MISYFFKADSSEEDIKVPLFATAIKAGFPSPADDYSEVSLNLNDHLIKNKAATFILRVQGDSMIGAGIHSGDLVIVDRSLTPVNRSVIVASVEGEFTLKRLVKEVGIYYLVPENPDYPIIRITEEMDFQIWGRVTSVIHEL